LISRTELLGATSELFPSPHVDDSIDDDSAHSSINTQNDLRTRFCPSSPPLQDASCEAAWPHTQTDLFDNLLQDSGVQPLSQILPANLQITSLDIWRNGLSKTA
jgi:hypothetical protein